MSGANNPPRTVLTGLLLALAVLAGGLHLADYAFKHYEEARYVTRARVGDALFDPPNLAYNDHGGVIPSLKPKGEYRILFFGDSFTHGVTHPAYSVPAALEKALSEAGTGKSVKVVNLGVPGSSFPSYIEQFAFWTAALEWDAAVVQVFTGNDFLDVARTPLDREALARAAGTSCERGLARGYAATVPNTNYFRFMDYLQAHWLHFRHGLLRAGLPLGAATAWASPGESPYRHSLELSEEQFLEKARQSLHAYDPRWLMDNSAGLDWMSALFGVLGRARAGGKGVLVMLSPPEAALSGALRERTWGGGAPGCFLPGLPAALAGRLAERAGLPGDSVQDVSACLARAMEQGRRVYLPGDTHWTVEGNDMAARALTARVLPLWFGLPASRGEAPCGVAPGGPSLDAAVLSAADRLERAVSPSARSSLELYTGGG